MPNFVRNHYTVTEQESNARAANAFVDAALNRLVEEGLIRGARLVGPGREAHKARFKSLITDFADEHHLNLQDAFGFDPNPNTNKPFPLSLTDKSLPASKLCYDLVSEGMIGDDGDDDFKDNFDARAPRVLKMLHDQDNAALQAVRDLKNTILALGYLPEVGRESLLLSSADINRGLGIGPGYLDRGRELKDERVIVCPARDLAGTDEAVAIEVDKITDDIDAAKAILRRSPTKPVSLVFVVNTGGHFVEAEIKLSADGSASISMEDSKPGIKDQEKPNNLRALNKIREALMRAGITEIRAPLTSRIVTKHTGEQTDGVSCPYFAARKIEQRLGGAKGIGDPHISTAKLALIKAATNNLPGLAVDPLHGIVYIASRKNEPGYRAYENYVRSEAVRIQRAQDIDATLTAGQSVFIMPERKTDRSTGETKVSLTSAALIHNDASIERCNHALNEIAVEVATAPVPLLTKQQHVAEIYQIAIQAQEYVQKIRSVTELQLAPLSESELLEHFHVRDRPTLASKHRDSAVELSNQAFQQLQNATMDAKKEEEEVKRLLKETGFKGVPTEFYKTLLKDTLFFNADAKTSASGEDAKNFKAAQVEQRKELLDYYKAKGPRQR